MVVSIKLPQQWRYTRYQYTVHLNTVQPSTWLTRLSSQSVGIFQSLLHVTEHKQEARLSRRDRATAAWVSFG